MLPVLAGQKSGSFAICRYRFFGAVEANRATRARGDIAKMANGNGTMGHFARRGGPFAGDHAVDEVAMMVLAVVKMDFAWADDGVEERFWSGFMFAATGPDGAIGSDGDSVRCCVESCIAGGIGDAAEGGRCSQTFAARRS